MDKKERDFWDKLKILTAASIPILVAIIASIINASINNSQTNLEYTKLAINLLSNPNQEDTNLKEWAVDIMEKLGPVPISKQLRSSLVAGKTVLSNEPVGSLHFTPNNSDGKIILDKILGSRSTSTVAVLFGTSSEIQQTAEIIRRRTIARSKYQRIAVWIPITLESQIVLRQEFVPSGANRECVIFISADRKSTYAYSPKQLNNFLDADIAFLKAEK